jgi:hypothetical protein
MGLFAAHDWSATPLGPLESWPAPLKHAADLALASPLASMVWWGPSRLLIYNQPCIPLLGERHPRALGRPADPGAAGWAPLAAAVDQALAGDHAVEVDSPALPGPASGPIPASGWTCVPIHDEGGVPAGAFVMATPSRPREASALPTPWNKESFLSAVAHELRSPLSALVLWSRMLRDGKLDESDRKKGLDMLRQAAEVQVNLVGELLDFARLSLGYRSLQLVPTALRRPIEAAAASLQERANTHGVTVELDLGGQDEASLVVDPVRLEQAWRHLLGSAIQAAGQARRVAVRARRVGEAIEVSVSPVQSASAGRETRPLATLMARQLLILHGAELIEAAPDHPAALLVRFPAATPPSVG